MSTPNTNERKWWQPQLQLYLVTKSCGRWKKLGLPTSSAAVLPLKMMRCTIFWSVQTFSVNGKFSECYHIFCAWIHLFTIFVCSRYRPWATIHLLHHFGFVMCVNSRLYCMHFLCHWCKICNVSHQLTQISKRQHDPSILCIFTTPFLSVFISAGVWATKGTGNYQVIEKNTDKRSR